MSWSSVCARCYEDRLGYRRNACSGASRSCSMAICAAVTKELLVLRLGEEGVVAALKQPHTREMDFTGKPMKSMAFVEPLGTRTDADLDAWVRRAVRFVRTLTPTRMKTVKKVKSG